MLALPTRDDMSADSVLGGAGRLGSCGGVAFVLARDGWGSAVRNEENCGRLLCASDLTTGGGGCKLRHSFGSTDATKPPVTGPVPLLRVWPAKQHVRVSWWRPHRPDSFPNFDHDLEL